MTLAFVTSLGMSTFLYGGQSVHLPVMHPRHMLELDVLEGYDQSLNHRPIWHEADLFQHEISVDMHDDKFRISLHLELGKSHL